MCAIEACSVTSPLTAPCLAIVTWWTLSGQAFHLCDNSPKSSSCDGGSDERKFATAAATAGPAPPAAAAAVRECKRAWRRHRGGAPSRLAASPIKISGLIRETELKQILSTRTERIYYKNSRVTATLDLTFSTACGHPRGTTSTSPASCVHSSIPTSEAEPLTAISRKRG